MNVNEETKQMDVHHLAQELRRGLKVYEAFKEAEAVVSKLEFAEAELKQHDQAINEKLKAIAEWNEKMDQAQKNHESNMEKRNIELQKATHEAEQVKKAATEFKEHERAKAAEFIRNANAHVESLKKTTEGLKKEIEDLKASKRDAEVQYDAVLKQLEQVRKVLG